MGFEYEFISDYPIELGHEYYTVEWKNEKVWEKCSVCGGKNKIEINGEFFPCPKCSGGHNKKGLQVLESRRRYFRRTYILTAISLTPGESCRPEATFVFRGSDGFGRIRATEDEMERGVIKTEMIRGYLKLYADKSECDKVVREMNKSEKRKLLK